MDSPGFSAVKGTYTLMNHETGRLISMQHGDKRQVSYVISMLTISFKTCTYITITGESKVYKPRTTFV